MVDIVKNTSPAVGVVYHYALIRLFGGDLNLAV